MTRISSQPYVRLLDLKFAKCFLFTMFNSGVNKKPKKIITMWHGFGKLWKLSGRVNQASLKLSAGFSNTVCLTSLTFFCVENCFLWLKVNRIEADFVQRSNSVSIQCGQSACSISMCHPNFCLSNEKINKTVLSRLNSSLVGFHQVSGFLSTPGSIKNQLVKKHGT